MAAPDFWSNQERARETVGQLKALRCILKPLVWRHQRAMLGVRGMDYTGARGRRGEQRMRNLADFYQNVQKWSAGPHLFVADDLIWAFTPLTVAGVHSPSWNSIAWGVEMVGDYNTEPFGNAVRDNVVSALTTLHAVLGLDPASLKLHKEDRKTTHDCPGRNVNKADIIARVQDALAARAQGEHSPAAGVHEAVVAQPA